jgi:hypothetical protein
MPRLVSSAMATWCSSTIIGLRTGKEAAQHFGPPRRPRRHAFIENDVRSQEAEAENGLARAGEYSVDVHADPRSQAAGHR